jgi:predicted dehydrogenase
VTEQRADIEAFVDCIDSGSVPEVTARDAVHHVEVIMAGYESAASGEPVEL